MDHAVGGGDVEQAVEHVLERVRAIEEEPPDLLGIGLVAGDILLRHLEQLVDLLPRWPEGISTVRWKARISDAVTTPSATAIFAESAISASVKAASLPPGSQVSGSSAFASEPATPVRRENDPTIPAMRCKMDTEFSALGEG